MKKNKYELYTLNHVDERGDDRGSDVYFVLLHGFDTDARGHKFSSWLPYGKSEKDDTPMTDIHIDHENPFILVPMEYADLIGQYTDTVAVVSPLYGDVSDVTVSEINKALTRIKTMITMFDNIQMLPSIGTRLTPMPTKKPLKKPPFPGIPKVSAEKDPTGVFGYMMDTRGEYRKRIIDITVEGEDTVINVKTKKLKESVEDIHAQYLRPIETAIGTCYECEAITVKYIAGLVTTLRGYMDPDLIKEQGFQIYKDALNMYPGLWSLLESCHKDVIRGNKDVIYERPTSFDDVDKAQSVDKLRILIKNTLNYCLDTANDVVDTRSALSDAIDRIDEDDVYKLATAMYTKSSKDISDKLLGAHDYKLINQEEFENGLISRAEAYQKHAYDPYYDD